jgi:hypothetical protein
MSAAATPAELARLEQVRKDLLRVHKGLLEAERLRYEAINGPVPNNMVFLQLVIDDPWFAWLRPMAQLVLLIDEKASDKQTPLGADEAGELYRQGRLLLSPDAAGDPFQRLFHDVVGASQKLAVLVHHVQQGYLAH